jgi:hypothetical protein
VGKQLVAGKLPNADAVPENFSARTKARTNQALAALQAVGDDCTVDVCTANGAAIEIRRGESRVAQRCVAAMRLCAFRIVGHRLAISRRIDSRIDNCRSGRAELDEAQGC